MNFKDRETAETAAEAWANGFEIDEEMVNVKWGRSRTKIIGTSLSTEEGSSVVS